jgi:nucleotidyltransferase-like protein
MRADYDRPMDDTKAAPSDDEVLALRERAKELRCLYEVIAALSRRERPPQDVFRHVLAAIPPAWQYPEAATARIEYLGRTHALPDFVDTPWRQRSPISVWRTPVGALEVHYKEARPDAWEGPFLREERQLLDNIAGRVGEYLEWKQRELGGERLGAEPEHWRWRQRVAERLAASLDPHRFGVRGLYLLGSTELGSAGMGSDIDLIVVFEGDAQQERELRAWLEGWSLCLAEMAFQLYGLPGRSMLDVRFLDPQQADQERLAAARAATPLRALPLGTAGESGPSAPLPRSRG